MKHLRNLLTLERSPSGLWRRLGKPVYPQGYRGFKSHPLRQVLHSAKLKDVAEAVSYDFTKSENWRCFLIDVRTFFDENPEN